MKKQFINLGKALSKSEQKLINGGDGGEGLNGWCVHNCNCGYGTTCAQKYCDSVLTWMCV